jgi:lysophospholipase L1-like esterase
VATAESVASSSFVFAACSGAVLEDFFINGQYGEGPQLNAIAPSNQPSLTTGLVTLSIGGNDTGFASIVKSCVSGFLNPAAGCQATITEDLNLGVDELVAGETFLYNQTLDIYSPCGQACLNSYNLLKKLFPNNPDQLVTIPGLTGLYADIHDRAPNAAIRVLLYPHLFPTVPTSRCTVGSSEDGFGHVDNYYVSVANMEALNNAADFLDVAIEGQVLLAQQTGINIQAVDPRPDFSAGHEICSNSNIAADSTGAWINSLSFGSFLTSPAPSSFHPNADGHADFAQLIEASL